MWVYRLGAERAKRMLFTGDLVTGKESEKMGLILQAVADPDCRPDIRATPDGLTIFEARAPSNHWVYGQEK